jgi:hypothetical protein
MVEARIGWQEENPWAVSVDFPIKPLKCLSHVAEAEIA